MSTKSNPSMFRCYEAALPDEPMFVILGRDPAGPATLEFWAAERVKQHKVHEQDDQDRIKAAIDEAKDMQGWRDMNLNPVGDGIPSWKHPRQIMDDDRPIRMMPESSIDVRHVWHDYDDPEGERPISCKPLTFSRMAELLDYATAYGEFDENTPSGTTTKNPDLSSPMNDMRRAAIWQLKRCMGIVPENTKPPEPDDGFKIPEVPVWREGLFAVPGVEKAQSMQDIADTYAKLKSILKPIPVKADYFAMSNGDQVTYEELDRIYRSWIDRQDERTDAALDSIYSKVMKPFKPSMELPADYGRTAADCRAKFDDLAKSPEVPPHRFAEFYKGEQYAYAKGLEVNPTHLPTALDEMAKDGWHLLAIFGATDSKHVGFIFERGIPLGKLDGDIDTVPFNQPFEGTVTGRWSGRDTKPSPMMKAYGSGAPMEEIVALHKAAEVIIRVTLDNGSSETRMAIAKRLERILLSYDGHEDFRLAIYPGVGEHAVASFVHKSDPLELGHRIDVRRTLWPKAPCPPGEDCPEFGRGLEP